MTPKETRELRGIIAAHPDIAARLLIAGRVLVANVAPHHIGCTADAVAALTPELFGREDERLVVLMLSRRHNL
jgi:DNA repair protein RadC